MQARYLALVLINEWVIRRPLGEAEQAAGQAETLAAETVRNADAVEAMGLMRGLRGRLQAWNDATLDPLDRASRRGGFISAMSRFLRYGLQIAVLGVGAMLVLDNQMTAGAIVAGSILAARALAPVDRVIASWRTLVTARSAFAEIKKVLTRSSAPLSATQLPRPRRPASISRRCLMCQARTKIRCCIRSPSRFRLAQASGSSGPTASGKTTLARILVGSLAPTSGHARLDGADVAQWASEDRGPHIGYVPQAVELFPGTVRDNISRLEAGDDVAVIRAARQAGIHDMILALPYGYDTVIGPGGGFLSGGQRAQIALARALYGEPAFVVLDEPNASLDHQGESELVKVLHRLSERGVTLVVISHRPNVMRAVDSLAVLQDGRLAAFGPRDEVLGEFSKAPNPKAIA